MKKLLLVLSLAFLMAACGTDSGNSGSRFGTWNKISASQGNYIGIGNVNHYVKSSARLSADTTAIDTSYIDNAGQISMSIRTETLNDNNYDFRLTLTDSMPSFPNEHFSFKYVSDSTAFTATRTAHTQNRDNYNKFDALFYVNCGSGQSKTEYVEYKTINKDSTQARVYKIRVDGMLDLAKDVTTGCYDAN